MKTHNTNRKNLLSGVKLTFLALIVAAGFSSCYVSHPYGARWVPGHWAPGYYHEHWVPGHWA